MCVNEGLSSLPLMKSRLARVIWFVDTATFLKSHKPAVSRQVTYKTRISEVIKDNRTRRVAVAREAQGPSSVERAIRTSVTKFE